MILINFKEVFKIINNKNLKNKLIIINLLNYLIKQKYLIITLNLIILILLISKLIFKKIITKKMVNYY